MHFENFSLFSISILASIVTFQAHVFEVEHLWCIFQCWFLSVWFQLWLKHRLFIFSWFLRFSVSIFLRFSYLQWTFFQKKFTHFSWLIFGLEVVVDIFLRVILNAFRGAMTLKNFLVGCWLRNFCMFFIFEIWIGRLIFPQLALEGSSCLMGGLSQVDIPYR